MVLSRDDEATRLDTIQRAFRLHSPARAVITDCAGPLAAEWHKSEAQINKVLDALGSVVGGAGPAPSPAPAQVPTSPPRPLVQSYVQSVHLFLAAVALWLRRWMPLRTLEAGYSRTMTNASFHRTRSWVRWPIASACCTGRSVDLSAAVRARRT
jgi:hypothetical protein